MQGSTLLFWPFAKWYS